jgi:predicted nuclease with TOPRIM domain
MQNALNEIESLKKERDELNAQVEAYGKSLEAVCMEKAVLDEKIYYLGIAHK